VREFPDEDKFEQLERLYEEFAADREARGIEAICEDYARLERAIWDGSHVRDRGCWCMLPPEEQDQWRPRRRRSRFTNRFLEVNLKGLNWPVT